MYADAGADGKGKKEIHLWTGSHKEAPNAVRYRKIAETAAKSLTQICSRTKQPEITEPPTRLHAYQERDSEREY
jgi:hypothetical protein